MIMEKILLVGYGGHAKSIADSIERQKKYCIAGYTDFDKHDSKYSYLGSDDNLIDIYNSGIRNAIIGIGYIGKEKNREKIAEKLINIGFGLPAIVDPSAIISPTAIIGEGTFIGKNAIINTEAKVGRFCIINTSAIIEHECFVDDFSHIAVASILCGQVCVGRGAFIGANATIIQNQCIEPYEIVPAGETVRKKR